MTQLATWAVKGFDTKKKKKKKRISSLNTFYDWEKKV